MERPLPLVEQIKARAEKIRFKDTEKGRKVEESKRIRKYLPLYQFLWSIRGCSEEIKTIMENQENCFIDLMEWKGPDDEKCGIMISSVVNLSFSLNVTKGRERECVKNIKWNSVEESQKKPDLIDKICFDDPINPKRKLTLLVDEKTYLFDSLGELGCPAINKGELERKLATALGIK